MGVDKNLKMAKTNFKFLRTYFYVFNTHRSSLKRSVKHGLSKAHKKYLLSSFSRKYQKIIFLYFSLVIPQEYS